jgi:hypothetical protein
VSWHGSTVSSHGVVHVVISAQLSSPHLLEICFERLIGVLNNERVLHGDRCW